jgi:hypothetical protein
LPIERTNPFERALSGRLARALAVLGRGTEHDHPARPPHPANRGSEERPRLPELLAVGDPAGIEHERLERLVLGRGVGIEDPGVKARVGRGRPLELVQARVHLGADRREHACDGAGDPSAGSGSEQDRPVDDRLPALVSLELHGAREADLLGDDLPDRRVHELLVAVAHAGASMIAVTPRPPAAQIEMSPRPEPFS